jgi:phosphoglycerol transferase
MDVRRWIGNSGPLLAQTVAVAVLVWSVLELWRFDFHVPFNYRGDSLWFALLAKSVAQNGWAYFVPQLSAPYGLDAAAFPAMTNLDWLIMKGISIVSKDPAVVFNVFWLCTIFFTAWTGLLSLRLLGVPSWLAALGGLLFTAIPFTWMRSTAHLSLVFYAVPLLCVFAVYLARGPVAPWKDTAYRRIGLLGACIQGFGYVYFSWFGILLFSVAGVLGYAHRRQREVIVWTAIGIAILVATSVINLAPSFYSWHKHGVPHIGYKKPIEAELYGLKIRRMLVPHPGNPIQPLSSWATRDLKAGFPNENENRSVRLGIFASLGFVSLIAISLACSTPHANLASPTLRALAALNLTTLLMTTVGGVGAIINTVTTPDIRAYNRFSVFIAFFAIAGLSLWLDALWRIADGIRKVIVAALVLSLGGLSLYDQVLDARWIPASYDRDTAVSAEVGSVVKGMEMLFPPGTPVFQLPITPFPVDPGHHRMQSYDHARAFLESNQLKWSWPSFNPRHVGWTQYIVSLDAPQLVPALATAGFGAVWVDRSGYRDRGRAVMESILSTGGVEVLQGVSRRYAVVDIRPAAGGRQGVRAAVGSPRGGGP